MPETTLKAPKARYLLVGVDTITGCRYPLLEYEQLARAALIVRLFTAVCTHETDSYVVIDDTGTQVYPCPRVH